MMDLVKKIATELKLNEVNAAQALRLLTEEDCTIPFVARYRKEMTGSMDEVVLRDLRDRYQYLLELETSKERYLKVIEEQAKTKPELAAKLYELRQKFVACQTKQELEDLYLPFKPKRRTKAMIAKEKGLDVLLDQILEQAAKLHDLHELARSFVRTEGEFLVPTPEDALQGASDIFAERVSETADFRCLIRSTSKETGLLVAKKIEVDETKLTPDQKKNLAKYENYFDYSESINTAQSHRIMAVRRGESEKLLRVSLEVDTDRILEELNEAVVKSVGSMSSEVRSWLGLSIHDSYKRLISSSIETELRLEIKNKAEEEAIKVFSNNLENLLLLPPIPGKFVLGVDPGIRTGSKLAVISETGKLIEYDTIYPILNNLEHPKTKEAVATLAKFMTKHKVGYVAVGNGTASREVDQLVIQAMKQHNIRGVRRVTVNEAGASVYSTDDIAREEFPDLDPTIRSAVSIARRLQDPLAELVKIDPRSIGVGQYQHDCNVVKLEKTLKETVESCVNRVGVNINTASHKLLSYVSGIGPALAKNIVAHRNDNGVFTSRRELEGSVKGFGPKAFQQAAGFLRVPTSANPLDNSAVHPERYDVVESIAKDLSTPLHELIGKKEVVNALNIEKYVTDSCGLPTLLDISQELIKPGRDPREDGSRLTFSDEVSTLEDLKVGMKLKGTVSNVTNFGAFVDIGVHQDGLVHISELSNDFITDPTKVVSVGDVIDVRVLDVDMERKRISLTCKTQGATAAVAATNGASTPKPQQQANTNRQTLSDGPRLAIKPAQSSSRSASGSSHNKPKTTTAASKSKGPGPMAMPIKRHSLDDLLNKFSK